MPEHPNVALIRKGYEAFARADMAALSELFAEDVVWHMPGRNPVSGVHRGREAVFAAFAKFFELSGGTLKLDVHAILADGEHAVALNRATASRKGKQLDLLGADVFHAKNGKIVEFWAFSEDQRLDDEFWSS